MGISEYATEFLNAAFSGDTAWAVRTVEKIERWVHSVSKVGDRWQEQFGSGYRPPTAAEFAVRFPLVEVPRNRIHEIEILARKCVAADKFRGCDPDEFGDREIWTPYAVVDLRRRLQKWDISPQTINTSCGAGAHTEWEFIKSAFDDLVTQPASTFRLDLTPTYISEDVEVTILQTLIETPAQKKIKCPNCGNAFKARFPTERYCTERCGSTYRVRMYRARMKAPAAIQRGWWFYGR